MKNIQVEIQYIIAVMVLVFSFSTAINAQIPDSTIKFSPDTITIQQNSLKAENSTPKKYLQKGEPIHLILTESKDSEEIEEGNTMTFRVVESINIGSTMVIRARTPVYGIVEKKEGARLVMRILNIKTNNNLQSIAVETPYKLTKSIQNTMLTVFVKETTELLEVY